MLSSKPPFKEPPKKAKKMSKPCRGTSKRKAPVSMRNKEAAIAQAQCPPSMAMICRNEG